MPSQGCRPEVAIWRFSVIVTDFRLRTGADQHSITFLSPVYYSIDITHYAHYYIMPCFHAFPYHAYDVSFSVSQQLTGHQPDY